MNSLKQKLYDASPVLLQNLAVSLYGFNIRRREYGREFEQLLAEFEKQQYYSLAEIENYQNEKLAALVKHCYANVPYYRELMTELKLRPDDIKTVDDLPKLPILTREAVQQNYDKLLATNIPPSDRIDGSTSGTTGISLPLIYDRQVCLVKTVVDWRQKRSAGLDVGARFASFLGHFVVPLGKNKPPFSRMNYALNNLLFSCFHMTPENLARYAKELIKFQPVAIEGYPSTAYIMARYLISQGKTVPVKAVFTSSETLYDYQREAIEKAFECKVFDYYGMAERVVYATECPAHEGNHLNMDFGLTEMIGRSGELVGLGEEGRIVATSLFNYAMPLIRYKTNDITALKSEPCSCGRKFYLFQNITTKAEDIVTTRSGKYVSPSVLNYPFDPMHKVAEAQYIQEDLDHMTIKLVKLPTWEETDSQKLIDEMAIRIGPDMEIAIEFVDEIPRTKSGKFRCVISKVELRF